MPNDARIPPPCSRCRIVLRATASAAAITPATNFHLVLHSVYKNPADAKYEQLQLLEELTLQRLDELNVDSLITVMFAFARSSYHPDGRIQHRMAAATEADMASFTPRQLEHAAWSLAHVGYRPSPRWLENFAQALQVNWDYFRPADLAVTLVEGASCGLTRLTRATLADQLPSALKSATATSAATAPGTLAKLVWSAGHFSCGAPSGQQAVAPLGNRAAREAPPDATITATATAAAAAAALAPSCFTSGRPASGCWVPPALLEEAVLAWWEDEAVLEAAEPSDLVLLLNGLARLGVRPAAGWTARLLEAVMGSPAALARLDMKLLALLAWSALKVVDSPPRREWLEAFVEALRSHLNLAAAAADDAGGCGPTDDAGYGTRSTDRGQGSTPSGASSGSGNTNITFTSSREGDLGSGCGAGKEEEAAGVAMSAAAAASARGAQPADVALALSSLAGLGAGLGAVGSGAGEVRQYWRGAGRWTALSQDDRLVMTLLGYGPGAGG